MKKLIALVILVCGGLVITANPAFPLSYDLKDIYITPNGDPCTIGNGFWGGDGNWSSGVNDQIDWSIGSSVPFDPNCVPSNDMVFSTNEGDDFYNAGDWKERMRITKDGNVGIGTMEPTAKLEVKGTIKAQGLDSKDGQKEMIFSLEGLGLLKISRVLSASPYHQGYYERLVEFVGPDDETQDLGRFNVYGSLYIDGSKRSSTQGIGPILSLHSTFPNASINRHFYIALGDTWNNWGTSEDDVILHSWDNSWQNHVQHMVLKANGNIGIGTTSPNATLDVNGYMKLSKNATEPAACDGTQDGSLALTSGYRMCVCNGTNWVFASDGITSCSW